MRLIFLLMRGLKLWRVGLPARGFAFRQDSQLRVFSVLVIMAVAFNDARAADIRTLKAALAERFAAYRTMDAKFESSGPDSSYLDDATKDIRIKWQWERMPNRERVDMWMEGVDPSSSIFDGVNTTALSIPDPDAKPVEGVLPSTGSAGISRGLDSDSGVIYAAEILGMSARGVGVSYLDLLNDMECHSILDIESNGEHCPAWEFTGTTRYGDQLKGRLAVDPQADWLPVFWEAVTTHKNPEGRTSVTRVSVMETMKITDESSGREFHVPKVTHIVDQYNAQQERRPLIVRINAMTLGRSISPHRFQVSIPSGFSVHDSTDPKRPRTYIAGGKAGEKAAEQELRAAIVQQKQVMKASPSAKMDASVPSYSLSWSVVLLLIAGALIFGSLYVQRS